MLASIHLPLAAALALSTSSCSPSVEPEGVQTEDERQMPATLPPPQTPDSPEIPADTEIQTTSSGLKYSVLVEGDGSEHPRRGDRVRVHYSVWTTDGKLFDSSVKRGEPSEFGIGQVIEGWNEGLALMSPGARYKLTIPPDLAYGERGNPPAIPPSATLVFEVELLAITARAMPYVAWEDSDEVQSGESGLRFRYLARGEGRPAAGADMVQVEYACYDDERRVALSSSMDGAPLMGAPKQMPLPFMTEAMGFLRAGDRVLLLVPSELGFQGPMPPGIDPQAPTLWQLELASAMTFTKPEFTLPTDEELTEVAGGLQYRILREGTGQKPKPTSQVTVHYQGWLTDGTAFDGSYDRGQPTSFGLNRVIGGWTQGLQLIGEGGMIQLVIPPDLAYGEGGRPPTIPANATLVFVIELIRVQG